MKPLVINKITACRFGKQHGLVAGTGFTPSWLTQIRTQSPLRPGGSIQVVDQELECISPPARKCGGSNVK